MNMQRSLPLLDMTAEVDANTSAFTDDKDSRDNDDGLHSSTTYCHEER